MICSIHQPHFLPWMGYFNKVLNSDVFVWLHSVQYRKNYFQNRTRIKNNNDEPQWITLPVFAHLGLSIDNIQIANSSWRVEIEKTITQQYKKTPYFSICWPALHDAIYAAKDMLEDIDYLTFVSILNLLDVKNVQIIKAKELEVQAIDPTLRLIEICKAVGADYYIAGRGGKNYMKIDEFANANIQLIWQNFIPEQIIYHQQGKTFLPGLSIIDCLFNMGPEETKNIITHSWSPSLSNR